MMRMSPSQETSETKSGGAKSLRPRVRLQGLVSAFCCLFVVATVLGFLGRWSWFLDLFSHFRVQYLAGLVLLCAVSAIKRYHRLLIISGCFACLNLVVILPLYFGGQSVAADTSSIVRVILINVNSRLGDPERVSQAIRDADPDLVVLEEVTASWLRNLDWLNEAYPYRLADPREDNFGIAVFSRDALTDTDVVYIGRSEVPTILATFAKGDSRVRVIATHPLPPAGRAYSSIRNEQLRLLPDFVPKSGPTLLVGDLNTTPWNSFFQQLLTESGLRDSGRGWGLQPTWPSTSPLLRIPLDHCLHSADIAIVDRRVGRNVGSDHFPLIVDFVVIGGGSGDRVEAGSAR